MGEILVQRGTDLARRDGPLGTPLQGEPIYCTDSKVLWLGDGATVGGIPASKPAALVTMYASTTQDINSSATELVEWNLHQTPISIAQTGTVTDLTHSNSTNKHLVTVNTSGIYELACAIAVDATASTPTRWNAKLRFVLNGSTLIGNAGQGGYLREASGQDETGLSIVPFTYAFSATDYFWVQCERESTTTAAVDTIPYASTCMIKRLA